MDKLLDAINDFYIREFDDYSGVEVPEDKIIPLCYTTYDFGDGDEHEIQVSIDCKNRAYLNYIDNELVLTEARDSLAEIAAEISCSGFEDIIRDCVYKGLEMFAG